MFYALLYLIQAIVLAWACWRITNIRKSKGRSLGRYALAILIIISAIAISVFTYLAQTNTADSSSLSQFVYGMGSLAAPVLVTVPLVFLYGTLERISKS